MYVTLSEHERDFPGYKLPKGYMARWIGRQEEIKEVNQWLKYNCIEYYSCFFANGKPFQEYTASIVNKNTALLIKMFWEHIETDVPNIIAIITDRIMGDRMIAHARNSGATDVWISTLYLLSGIEIYRIVNILYGEPKDKTIYRKPTS